MVPGEGRLPALGLVLGEAPGRREVELGRPFVGPSGALLDQAFRLLDISREDLYVTNLVKEWPRDEVGATRRPSLEEIERWRPLLDRELRECSPGAILLLGKTAAESWGYTDALIAENIFSAWHPAYVLRTKDTNPKLLDTWFFQLNPFVRAVKSLQAAL